MLIIHKPIIKNFGNNIFKMKSSRKLQSKLKFSSGFTLMEVLVSVTVLSVGVVGAITLLNSSTSMIANSNNKVIAVNLAQEGIELVRNVRDTNFLRITSGVVGASWDDNLVQAVGGTNQLKFFCSSMDESISAFPPGSIDACGASCQVYLYHRGGYRCYSDDFNTPYNPPGPGGPFTRDNYSGFSRFITVTKVDTDGNPVTTDDDHILATVVIKWFDKGVAKYLTVNERLYDWK